MKIMKKSQIKITLLGDMYILQNELKLCAGYSLKLGRADKLDSKYFFFELLAQHSTQLSF